MIIPVFTSLLSILHVFLRPWDDETLGRAYDVLLDELVLPPSAPGGKVEFRRSLTLSLLFKFNLEVLQKLREMVRQGTISVTSLADMLEDFKGFLFAERD